MNPRHVPVVGVAAALAISAVGCFDFNPRYNSQPYTPAPTTTATHPPTSPTSHPPTIDSVEIPSWPPIGHDGTVQVTARDSDANLSAIRFDFANSITRVASGNFALETVSGDQLGEGFGTLTITASDDRGGNAKRVVNNFLVDLSPPKIVLGQTVLPTDADLELWVGDAWVLGKVKLSCAGMTLEQDFEPGYPDTVGTTWDYSLVKFPLAQLPTGGGAATITAVDAAGNSTTSSFDLVIDGDPPSISIDAPADGATVTGTFTVALSASDLGDGPVWTSVSLGGTPVGDASSDQASLQVNAGDFASGPNDLVAIATDRAGNQSSAKIVVNVQ
jgi:hypothetical protein